MVTADLRESACERGGRAASLPTVRLHFYRDCTLIPPRIHIAAQETKRNDKRGWGPVPLFTGVNMAPQPTQFWCPLFSTPLEAVLNLFSVRRRRRSLLALVIAPPIYDMSTSVVTNISQLLESLISRNDQACLICIPGFILHNLNLLDHSSSVQLPLTPSQITPFHSSRPPAISVRSYLEDRCSSPAQ